MPKWVEQEEITKEEAAAYLRWAFEQVDIAATIYGAVVASRLKAM